MLTLLLLALLRTLLLLPLLRTLLLAASRQRLPSATASTPNNHA
jgi:hypothetical protein